MKTTFLQYLKTFGFLMAAFWLFGIVSCLMPTATVQRHIYQSVHRGDLTEDYPLAILPRKQCQMDNFTDALILNQAYRMSSDSLLRSTLSPSRAAGPWASVDVLRNQTEGQVDKVMPYPRYWHGSTFLARILLVLGDYTRLRFILYMASTLLLVFTGIALFRRCGPWPVAMLLLALMGVHAFVMEFSLQFFPVLAISLVAIWLIARWDFSRARIAMLMFIVGALTAYFDLLTAPLMTLGLPLCFMLWLMPKESSFREMFVALLVVGATWAAGYAGAWAFKWLLATVVLQVNVFSDAYSNVMLRANELEDYTRLDAVTQNFGMLSASLLCCIAMMLVVVLLLRFDGRGWRRTLLFLLLAAMPYVWYLLVANHSYLHWWFTFRSQAVSLLAMMMAFLSLADFNVPRRKFIRGKS